MAANDIVLAADGSGDYYSLDEAIEAAEPGATITLSGGEHWLDFPLVINKSIRMVGEGVDSTLVVCRAQDTVVEFEGPGLFEAVGISFWHDGKQWADVVRISGGTARFQACRFSGGVWSEDKETGGDGLAFAGTSGGTVQGCECYDNALHGIEISGQSRPDLEENACTNNKENGIAYFEDAGGTARNNRCEGNGLIGIAVNGRAVPALINNHCSRNQEAGIAFFEFSGGSASGNICQENDLYGLIVQDDASPALEANTTENNPAGNRLNGKSAGPSSVVPPIEGITRTLATPPIPIAPGKTVELGNPGGDLSILEEAITTAGENGTVRLAPGEYRLSQPLSLKFPIHLSGAGRDLTMISCREQGWVVAYDAIGSFQAEGITFRHEGEQWADTVRIKAGEIAIEGCRFTGAVWSDADEQGGDGLSISGSVRGSIRACEFTGNALHGIEVGGQATPLLAENTVTHNEEDGIACFENAGGRIFKNRCESNGIYGIALNDQAHPDLVENVCSRNGEAGIGFFDRAGATVSGNVVEENTLYGLEITGQARPILAGNIVNHNLARDIENTAAPFEAAGATPEPPTPAIRAGRAEEQPAEEVFVTIGLEGGLPGLEMALRQAGPGATIHLSAGEHILKGPLTIDQTVRLLGEGLEETTIITDGEGYVIRYISAGKLSAEGITFQHTGKDWADVVSVESGEVDFLRCAFAGAIYDPNHDRGGNGLVLAGDVSGSVSRCESIKNRKDGILVTGQSKPALISNICRQNGEVGITFSGSSVGLARENHCNNNSIAGILVSEASHPTLRGNVCHANQGDGIAYEGQSGGSCRENQCLDNNGNGVDVAGEANPTLENNSCHRNEDSGLSFRSNARGTARENTCDENQSHGIAVADQAQPVLETNACSHNGEAGIAFFDDASGKAWGNQCEANQVYGIAAQDRAQPMLEANTCHQNKIAGIAFIGNARGIARENTCTDNQRYGLLIEDGAHPELVANQSRDNRLEDEYDSNPS